MYGKHFASMYSGSLFGKPATVFAVWGYVIAHMRPSRKDQQCYVELNPALLAATFDTTPEEIDAAIQTLEAPDPASRTKEAEGRRLVLLEEERTPGPMQFMVVNGSKYRALRDEEERRIYLREAKRASRASQRKSTKSLTVNHGQPQASQAEVEAEVEEEKPRSSCPSSDDFEQFWGVWEKKIGKGKARLAFSSLTKKGSLPPIEELIRKVRELQATDAWSENGRQYQPHPSTWLSREGWLDEIPKNSGKNRSKSFLSMTDAHRKAIDEATGAGS